MSRHVAMGLSGSPSLEPEPVQKPKPAKEPGVAWYRRRITLYAGAAVAVAGVYFYGSQIVEALARFVGK